MIAIVRVWRTTWGTRLACPKYNSGFTLLEVLIASALTAVLLAALWSMLSIYAELYDKGQAKTEHAQLARSLQKQLTDDLWSVCLETTDARGSQRRETSSRGKGNDEPTSVTTPSESSSTARATSQDDRSARPNGDVDFNSRSPEDAPAQPVTGFTFDSASLGGGPTTTAQRVGLVGTPTSLVLDVLVPVDPYLFFAGESEDTSAESLRAPLSRVPELQCISYTFAGPNPLVSDSSFSGLVRSQSTWEQAYAANPRSGVPGNSQLAADAPADGTGFVPWDTGDEELVDDFPHTRKNQTSTAMALSEPVIDRIPEVIYFQLRYFDGVVWRTQWNSRREKSLPVAVEVQFDLQRESERGIGAVPAGEIPVPDAATPLESEQSKLTDDTLETGVADTSWPEEADRLLDVDQLPQHRVLVYLDRNDTLRQQQATGQSMSEIQGGSSP